MILWVLHFGKLMTFPQVLFFLLKPIFEKKRSIYSEWARDATASLQRRRKETQ